MSPVDARERDIAARDDKRNLVVIAGAGTGKTSLLVERLLHRVLEIGTPIERIAAITFTEKAAAELRERLEEALEAAAAALADGAWPEDSTADEARRVLERMALLDTPRGRRAAVAAGTARKRALEALERMDDATLTTIHSFAQEIVRRSARATGVDPQCTVDASGEAFDEVLGELWDEHLAATLGPGASEEDVAAWRAVLAELPIDAVEDIARAVAKFGFDAAALEGDAEAAQRAHVEAFVESLDADLEFVRSRIVGVKGINPNLTGKLADIAGLLERLRGHPKVLATIAEELADLGSAPRLGAGADLDDKENVDATKERLWKRLEKLAEIKIAIAAPLQHVLLPLVARCRATYLERGFIAFDAMLVLARDLLRDDLAARRTEAARLDHLLIDEFQDNDPVQYEIAFLLCAESGFRGRDAFEARLRPGALFIVGDPKQSIYRFRGADIVAYRRALETIRKSDGAELTLRTNFRSVPALVEPLNELFERTFDAGDPFDPPFDALAAWREDAGGPRVEIWTLPDDLGAPARREKEGTSIAAWIAGEVAAKTMRCADVAILLRKFTDAGLYLEALRERGVPAVVQSRGRDFHTRHEVEMLVALLRAVVDPADEVALVGWLRSAAGGVPDRELHEHARAHAERAWRLDAEVDAKRCPKLGAALALLREVAARHRTSDIGALARAALRETPLLLAAASMYDGAQRVANVEKAVRRIGELALDGRLSDVEVLDRFEGPGEDAEKDGDSPLADDTVDAVRVLTIHGAKGLEWPVVVLPDLAAKLEGSGGGDVVVKVARGKDGALPAALALSSKGVQTPAFPTFAEVEREHARAEKKRLLYVAATRARERLVLVAGKPHKAPGDGTWLEALAAWGYHWGEHGAKRTELAGGRVVHRIAPEASDSPVAGDETRGADDDALVAAVERLREAARELAELPPESLRRPSGARAERDDDGDGDDGGITRREARTPRDVARAGGTALHLLLEAWDRRDRGWLATNAMRAARVVAAREGLDEAATSAVAERVGRLVEEAERTGALERLETVDVVARELPLLYRDADGASWQGTIDLLQGPLERLEVVDYKTTASREAPELEREHAEQLEVYRRAVQAALELGEAPAARVEPLVSDETAAGDAPADA